MKILRIASDLYPEVMGGLSLHVHEMSRLQAKDGHDVTVVTSDHGDFSLPRREMRDGYQIVRHREVAAPVDNSIAPGVIKSVFCEEFDIIHAHSHLFFSTNLVSLISTCIDAPLVITNHGLLSQTAPKWLQHVYLPLIAKPTLQSADRILCYTKTDKSRLATFGISTKVSVVHNGVDCTMFSPDPSVEDAQQILFVGRLKAGKGVELLIDAFDQVHKEFPDYQLTIIGDGPLKDSLKEKSASLGLSKSVEFCGDIPNENLPRIYNKSSILLLLSENEGLPRTVLEALACGTPVITSNLPQLEPIVNGSGFVVDRTDIEAISDLIQEILADKELSQEFSRVGRKTIVNRFSWAETVRQTTKEMRELIKNNG